MVSFRLYFIWGNFYNTSYSALSYKLNLSTHVVRCYASARHPFLYLQKIIINTPSNNTFPHLFSIHHSPFSLQPLASLHSNSLHVYQRYFNLSAFAILGVGVNDYRLYNFVTNPHKNKIDQDIGTRTKLKLQKKH